MQRDWRHGNKKRLRPRVGGERSTRFLRYRGASGDPDIEIPGNIGELFSWHPPLGYLALNIPGCRNSLSGVGRAPSRIILALT